MLWPLLLASTCEDIIHPRSFCVDKYFHSLGCLSRHGIAGTGNLLPKISVPFLTPSTSSEAPLSTALAALPICHIDWSHPGGCDAACQGGFDLHFLSDSQC